MRTSHLGATGLTAALAALLLGALTGCFGQDPAHPDAKVDRATVGYDVYRGCMAGAGWMVEGSVDIDSDQQRFARDDHRCAASAQLFTLPSLAERIRTYRSEVRTARCLAGFGVPVTPPTLAQYLSGDIAQPWSPYRQLRPYSPSVLSAMRSCPDPDDA